MKVLHKIQGKLWLVTFPLALGLVYLVASQKDIGWQKIFNALENFTPMVWVGVLLCMVAELFVQLLRSWVMLKVDKPTLKFPTVAKAGLAAFSAGSFTPGRLGDSAMVLLIPGMSARAIGITLVDRLMFWPPMHVLGSLALGFLLYPEFGTKILVLAFAVAIGYTLIGEWIFHKTRISADTHSSKKFIRELYHGFALLPKNSFRLAVLLGFAQYFFIMLQFHIGLVAIGHHESLFQTAIIFGSLQLLRGFFSFTPGNLGVSEIIGMKLGEYAGMSADTLPMVTIPFFLTNTVVPALVGFPFWIIMSRRLKGQPPHD